MSDGGATPSDVAAASDRPVGDLTATRRPTDAVTGDRLLERLGGFAGPAVIVVAFVLLVGYPLARLALAAVGLTPDADLTGRLPPAVVGSLVVAIGSAVIAVALGVGAALATERGGLPRTGALRFAIVLALLPPPFVGSIGWLEAYGPAGLTDQLLGFSAPWLLGPVGVVLVLGVSAASLVYLITAPALASRIEPDLERAARVSGARTVTALRTVTLPLLRPAVGAAAVLAFVLGLNAFGVPAVLGSPAGFSTMTTQIYEDLVFASDPAAFGRVLWLAGLLALIALAAALVGDRLLPGRLATRTGESIGATTPARRRAAPTREGRRGQAPAVLALATWTILAIVCFVPLAALVLTAITRAVGVPPVPSNWTLANFGEALRGRTAAALLHSAVLGGLAATAVVVLGGTGAAIAATVRSPNHGRGRRGPALSAVTTLAFAVPGSALAVGLLIAYAGLRDTAAIILVAYIAKFWALGHRPIAAASELVPPDLVRAGRTMGASPRVVLRTVIVPMLAPVVAATWLLVFLFALHELTMSSLLYGPGSETLSVAVLNLQELGDPTVTAALAVMLTAVVALAAAPLVLLRRRIPLDGWR